MKVKDWIDQACPKINQRWTMKRYVLQLLADVYLAHLYKSCNYDIQVVTMMKRFFDESLGGEGSVPTVPASLHLMFLDLTACLLPLRLRYTLFIRLSRDRLILVHASLDPWPPAPSSFPEWHYGKPHLVSWLLLQMGAVRPQVELLAPIKLLPQVHEVKPRVWAKTSDWGFRWCHSLVAAARGRMPVTLFSSC